MAVGAAGVIGQRRSALVDCQNLLVAGLPAECRNIQLYLAVHDMQSAQRWVERLHDRLMRAAAMPFSGRMVPEFEEPTIREVFEGPYRIVYKVRSGEMRILTVVHGRRQLPSLERIDTSDT